jgi:hypothetical protein
MTATGDVSRNRLLASLGSRDLDRLRVALKPVELPLGTVLEEPNEPIKGIFFF